MTLNLNKKNNENISNIKLNIINKEDFVNDNIEAEILKRKQKNNNKLNQNTQKENNSDSFSIIDDNQQKEETNNSKEIGIVNNKNNIPNNFDEKELNIDQFLNKESNQNDEEIVNLELNNDEKIALGIKNKFPVKKFFKITIPILIIIILLNPLKLKPIKDAETFVFNKITNIYSSISEKIRTLQLVSGDDKNIVVDEDLNTNLYSFNKDYSTNNVVLNLYHKENSKGYFIIIEKLNSSNESNKDFIKNAKSDFNIQNYITSNNEYLSVNAYDYNPIFNYSLEDANDSCYVMKISGFENGGNFDFYLSCDYDRFINVYLNKSNYKISIREEY